MQQGALIPCGSHERSTIIPAKPAISKGRGGENCAFGRSFIEAVRGGEPVAIRPERSPDDGRRRETARSVTPAIMASALRRVARATPANQPDCRCTAPIGPLAVAREAPSPLVKRRFEASSISRMARSNLLFLNDKKVQISVTSGCQPEAGRALPLVRSERPGMAAVSTDPAWHAMIGRPQATGMNPNRPPHSHKTPQAMGAPGGSSSTAHRMVGSR